jgi:general secretion pathway protein I
MSAARQVSDEGGFTLLEVLVALAIFSIAALALLNLESVTTTNSIRLQDRTFGQIVAQNVAVETLTDPSPPALGQATGQEASGNRQWLWSRETRPSPEPRILQITIAVTSETGDHAAELTVFRPAPQ